MADPTLTEFVQRSLAAGASRDDVRTALTEAGWSSEQIADALGSFADVEFAVPVPMPKPQLQARDAFVYLVMFITLYLSAYYFGNLLFQYVDLIFTDELLRRPAFIYGQIRFATATLLVAFPIFLYVSRRTVLQLEADPTQRTSAVRRWLTYLTLFLSAAIIVGDLISLVFNLLSGGLTAPFIVKALIMGAIAGAVFTYYLWTMRQDGEAVAQ